MTGADEDEDSATAGMIPANSMIDSIIADIFFIMTDLSYPRESNFPGVFHTSRNSIIQTAETEDRTPGDSPRISNIAACCVGDLQETAHRKDGQSGQER
jgi:hypothetical protein